MYSSLYVGSVSHLRTVPFEHGFNYRLFMAYLDLAELDSIFARISGWSTNRATPVQFKRADHIGDPARDLGQSIRALIQQQTGRDTVGPIRLLTHLRYFGHCFNPVSFYYCFDRSGSNVETVVAEVNNTPWHEQHCYVMPVLEQDTHGRLLLETNKCFHVSPFLPMDMQYRFRLAVPNERLSIDIEVDRLGGPVFQAHLTLLRQPLTQKNAWMNIAKFPAMTLKLVSAIYWQAVRLKLKGATYYPHTTNR
jgi:uncharacterized protein